MGYAKLSASLLIIASLGSGCAAIKLSEEVEGLQKSSKSFGESLRTLDSEAAQALDVDQRSTVEQRLATSNRVQFDASCGRAVQTVQESFDAALDASPYDPARVDAAYRQIHYAPLCDLEDVRDGSRPSNPAQLPKLLPATGSLERPAVTGEDTLSASSRALDDYVDAVADLAGNKSGAAKDEARNRVFASGGALLAALGVPVAAPISGFLGQIVASIDQAARNRRIRDYLTAYNQAMPHLMERMGTAGRSANFQLLSNRAAAAARYASTANGLLNRPPLLPGGASLAPPPERVLIYRAYADRIGIENGAIAGHRKADPMAAARGFAKAHDALARAYASPRANFASLVAGLKDFKAAADELEKALEEAKES